MFYHLYALQSPWDLSSTIKCLRAPAGLVATGQQHQQQQMLFTACWHLELGWCTIFCGLCAAAKSKDRALENCMFCCIRLPRWMLPAFFCLAGVSFNMQCLLFVFNSAALVQPSAVHDDVPMAVMMSCILIMTACTCAERFGGGAATCAQVKTLVSLMWPGCKDLRVITRLFHSRKLLLLLLLLHGRVSFTLPVDTETEVLVKVKSLG